MRLQRTGDNWSGLPAATRDQLEVMLAGRGGGTEMAEVIFASQLHFLRAADSEWCLEHVMPLLDWADLARARRTWHGFLAWVGSTSFPLMKVAPARPDLAQISAHLRGDRSRLRGRPEQTAGRDDGSIRLSSRSASRTAL
jgi:hypothetical protein